jgi:hypothetical protein
MLVGTTGQNFNPGLKIDRSNAANTSLFMHPSFRSIAAANRKKWPNLSSCRTLGHGHLKRVLWTIALFKGFHLQPRRDYDGFGIERYFRSRHSPGPRSSLAHGFPRATTTNFDRVLLRCGYPYLYIVRINGASKARVILVKRQITIGALFDRCDPTI